MLAFSLPTVPVRWADVAAASKHTDPRAVFKSNYMLPKNYLGTRRPRPSVEFSSSFLSHSSPKTRTFTHTFIRYEPCIVVAAASSASFDIVSDFDVQELVNAVDQTNREIKSRFDLKDTKSIVTLQGDKEISIESKSDMTLDSIITVLQLKASKRNLSLKIFELGDVERAGGDRVRQTIKLRKGLDSENAKAVSKVIRDEFKKMTPQIQGDLVRVTSKSRDDLQLAIQRLKEVDKDFPVALQFINFR
mmetsp:Transcript_54312/g.90286  ORF Transcript_54312/g.90286 Transcript_54312/m.90286 type:complete len:247 (+) Transcript_54312:39-779(+)